MRRLALWLTLVLGLFAAPALAQTSPLAPQSESATAGENGEAAPAGESGGLWARTLLYVQEQQRSLHRELTDAVKALRANPSLATAWSLILLSFLYGVFHAAGPGHGKAVISTYLLTHESRLKRGIGLAVGASMLQAVTAIVIVQVFVALVGWTRREAQGSVGWLESFSFALIGALGLYLMARAGRSLYRAWRPATASGDNAHDHGHAHGADCGHQHMPDPAALDKPLTLKAAAAMIFSIGIRPCSGGVLVLIFAEVLGLAWAGVVAVFAMAVGTAITVSSLAALAVGSRNLAQRLVAGDGRRLSLAAHGVGFAGGLVIAALGASLFFGSLGPGHPLL
jgi:ABC-type nickel/cobalt efflux system permease component RcnA